MGVESKTTRFCVTNRKQQAPPWRGASTAEATLGRIGRGEQGEAGTGNSTPRGGPHREQACLRLKTWFKNQISSADTTPQHHRTYVYGTWFRAGNERQTRPLTALYVASFSGF